MSANCCCNLNPRPPASLFCARLIELHVFFCDFISSKSTVIFMIFELAIVVRLAADTGRAFLFTVFVIVYEKLCCLFWSYILIPESMIGVTTWEHPAAAKLFWGPRRPRDLNAEAFLGKLLLLVWKQSIMKIIDFHELSEQKSHDKCQNGLNMASFLVLNLPNWIQILLK